VITRRRKIILIQLVVFIFTIFLLFNTYLTKNEKEIAVLKIEPESDPNTNHFTDVEYSGFDLNGNRYILNAEMADFETKTPESVNMKKVVANFYLKDNTILQITSEKGFYNNITLDMKFRENVKSVHQTNTLLSDELNYLSSDAKMFVSGNVRGISEEKGEFFADNVEYDLKSKILNFSMFSDKQINVKINDQ
jgi:hypothetical protein|tara:strand:+ start:219 stop:797 length:579 start_codon:yes stop_codon:yes gene_type:complete